MTDTNHSQKYYFNDSYTRFQVLGPEKKNKQVIIVKAVDQQSNDETYLVTDLYYPYSMYPKASDDIYIDFIDQLLLVDSILVQKPIDHEIINNDDHIRVHVLLPYIEQSLHDVMELHLSSESISNKILDGPTLKNYMLQIANALADLHDNALIHGNLKPNNIRLDSHHQIILTDPEIMEFSNKHGFKNTDPETIKTLLWGAPEQLNAQETRIDPRTDIWAIGVLLFQLMQGEHPFIGSTPEEILINVASEYDNSRQLNNVPKDLEMLVENCLYKDPNKRFRSIHAFIKQLNQCSFEKKCKRGHVNPYNAVRCQMCSLYLDQDSQEQENLKFENIELPKVAYEIPVHKDYNLVVDIYPSQGAGSGGAEKNIHITFPQLAEPVVIPLLPAPIFSIHPQSFVVSRKEDSHLQTLRCELILKEGEAIVEKVQISLEEKTDAITTTNIPSNKKWLSSSSKGKPHKLELFFSLDLDRIEIERIYHVQVEVDVKNRNKPVFIDSYADHINDEMTLKIANPPRLYVHIKNNHVIKIQKGSSLRKSLKMSNQGGGQIKLISLNATFPKTFENHHNMDIKDIIYFEEIESLYPFDNQDQPVEILYDIDTKFIPAEIDQLPIVINFNYESIKESQSKEEIKHITIIFSFFDRKIGELLAIDFGTTNSYWACYTKNKNTEYFQDTIDYINQSEPINNEGFIPSFIHYEYQDDNQRYRIGKTAEAFFLSGKRNVFQSFKLDIGKEEFYQIISDGKLIDKEVEMIAADFIRELIANACNCTKFNFDQFIFTHPSRMSLRSFQKYIDIIEKQLNIDNYELIDEATAAAFDYIKKNIGEYYLLIYDFGGGTIDITFLYVNNYGEDVLIEYIETDGLPNYGGNNITDIVKEMIIDKIKENHDILLPSGESDEWGPDDDAAYINNQILWAVADDIKKNLYSMKTETRFVNYKYYDAMQIKESKIAVSTDNFKVDQLNEIIRSSLEDSLHIILRMMERVTEKEKKLPIKIVLSGGSSTIPFLVDLFEYFKDKYDFDYDHLEHSPDPKGCVATGALNCYEFLGSKLILEDRKVNWSRFGVRVLSLMDGATFVEYIPQGKKLCPVDRDIEQEQLSNYAVCEKDYTFFFLKNNKLKAPIDIYEHFGRDNEMIGNKYALVGRYMINKPENIESNEVHGLLRLEIKNNYQLSVKALIKGKYIDAEEM